jgi:maleylpyruvate isomerase
VTHLSSLGEDLTENMSARRCDRDPGAGRPRCHDGPVTDLDTARSWWAQGEQAVAEALDRLTDDQLREPSTLPGWSRAHVLAHLARNADALVNLCRWARTGVETPMYPSRQARDADIETTAGLSAGSLRAEVADARARLAEAVAVLPDDAWHRVVRNGQGRNVPATEIPWMRAKEVWVHGVDLAAGVTFADAPDRFLPSLVDDVLAVFASRDQLPDVTIRATDIDRTWCSGAASAQGPVAAVAAWLTRSDASGLEGTVPELPRWL